MGKVGLLRPFLTSANGKESRLFQHCSRSKWRTHSKSQACWPAVFHVAACKSLLKTTKVNVSITQGIVSLTENGKIQQNLATIPQWPIASDEDRVAFADSATAVGMEGAAHSQVGTNCHAATQDSKNALQLRATPRGLALGKVSESETS